MARSDRAALANASYSNCEKFRDLAAPITERNAMTTPGTEQPYRVAESALTIREVADALGRSPDFVYHLILSGRLVGARKELGRWLVPAHVVRTHVKAARGAER